MKTTFLTGIIFIVFFAPTNAQFISEGTDILHTDRKVGIGNETPGFKLDVYDNSGTDVVGKFETNEGFIAIAAAGNSTINPTYGNYISSHITDVFTYKDLGLKTAPGVPQFLLKTNGNVGIGVDPGFKLDVYDNSGTDVVAKFKTNDGFIAVAAAGSSTINPTYGNYISSFNANNTYKDLGLKTAPGVPQFLLKTNGNVGIGVDPGIKLDVYENSGTDVVAKFKTNDGFIAVAAAGSSTINPTYGNYISSFNANNTYKDLGLKTAPGVPQLVLKTTGNVGIGTVNPGNFRLAVNGQIRAKEIKVEANWSDFVFEDDYNLRPLADVEAFILANKHLPDIPSAVEVEENGVNLGEIGSKLLQKIEELTLYTIGQEKRIKQQEKRIKQLEEKIRQANSRD
ncbi:hypothetical protein QQ020_33920 [Fulvivirgaceae bacterium BMA12]|uniref:Peptidase S74 domain-containing protein n=1 Tax=Agaribacillus aureus TaxID=3051825 RepID=A0ABT8LH36_9BACT|nr:hypothetical protein [Fulvivirgaceae bacterium BMA12]